MKAILQLSRLYLPFRHLAALLLLLPLSAGAVTPIHADAITLAPIDINVATGEQYDPHVDQDLAAYSETPNFQRVIHYFQFGGPGDATIDRALPGGLFAQDFLSDVQGGRIVFNRAGPLYGDTSTQLFDVATQAMVEINPQPGSIRYGVSLGGNTVAYADMSVVNPVLLNGDIFAWNVLTHAVQRLTDDALFDESPSVSPAGDVIVWEKCTAAYVDCAVFTARPSATGWVASPVIPGGMSGQDPDTSSTTTAWESDMNPTHPSDWDIQWISVGGTIVQRLPLAGDQYHPAVAGDVIAFESQDPVTFSADLYLYEIATNRLFRLTNTPLVDETLNDISLLPTGELRIVWQANDNPVDGSNDIHGATFRIPNLPPLANAGVDQAVFLHNTAYLDGSASSDPEGVSLSYHWSIQSAPASSIETLVNPDTVNPRLTPDQLGTYVIALVVNDGQQDSAASTVQVMVTENLPPVAVAAGNPDTGLAPLTVNFDALGSSDPEGGALTYQWDFGDCTPIGLPACAGSSSATPAHVYVGSGIYTAVLTVTDDFLNSAQASVVVTVTVPNSPPTLAPTATPSSGLAPLYVQFVAHAVDADGDALTVLWNFGDGSTASGDAVNHSYANAGTYTATVTAADGVNAPVSSSLTISAGSDLTIKVTEGKVEFGEHGKVKGKIDLKADFTYPGLPAAGDRVMLSFDGIVLVDTSLASFTQVSAGVYEYEQRNVHARLDFNQHTVKVSRHRVVLTGLDNSNGIDVVMVLGNATATTNFVMHEKAERRDEEREWSHKVINPRGEHD